MHLCEEELYAQEIREIADSDLPWQKLSGKRILISGATGMIGSFLIGVLMERPERIEICALGRDRQKAMKRLMPYMPEKGFSFIEHDISNPILSDIGQFDYIIHAASSTHPRAYATHPVSTITANVMGTDNLLKYGVGHGLERFVFISSVEIYGENRGDIESFKEDYLGYIDCNTMRAGYPEGKRLGESLCQSYMSEFGIEAVMPRLSRTYGPGLLSDDSKAISQFIHKAAADEDIVLKSEGNQLYSYSYTPDAVSGILYTMLMGENGGAYNVADPESDITLRDLAGILADIAGTRVIFELPDAVEKAGYSTATRATLCPDKLLSLGWRPHYHIREGLERTVGMISNLC